MGTFLEHMALPLHGQTQSYLQVCSHTFEEAINKVE